MGKGLQAVSSRRRRTSPSVSKAGLTRHQLIEQQRNCSQLFFDRDRTQFENFVDKRTKIPSFVNQLFGLPQVFPQGFFESPGKTCVVDDKIDFFNSGEGTVARLCLGVVQPRGKDEALILANILETE